MSLELETQAARAEDTVDDPTMRGLARPLCTATCGCAEAVPVETLPTETLIAEVFCDGVGEGSA